VIARSRDAANPLNHNGPVGYSLRRKAASIVDSFSAHAGVASFVPRFRREALAGEDALPSTDLRFAAILLIDVVGFTAMADEAIRQGIVGAEKLAETINRWLADIFQTIDAWGGDVYVVAGDAIIAVWFTGVEVAAADAVAAAVQAGLSIQAENQEGLSGNALLVRSSVCVGPIRYSELGGRGEEWHGVLAGNVLTELGTLDRQGLPGAVLASEAAWRLISNRARGRQLAEVAFQISAVSGAPAPPVARSISRSITSHRLAAVVPRMVADWMGAGLDVSRVGQFRTVTVIFLLLEGMDPGSSEGVDVLQAAVVAAQSACADLQGSIYQILGDEKGISVVAAYGLPPMSHEDDAARAVRTGFRFQRAVGELGLIPSIGIATGRAFCCVYGHGDRRQFAIVGPVMNLAARLMQAHKGLVCDAETLHAARHHHTLDARELPPLILKGKSAPVICYTPFVPPVRGELPVNRVGAGELIGRSQELTIVDGALETLRSGRGGAVVIEGEPGIGKSMVVARALANARFREVRSLVGSSDDIEQSTSYFPWRTVFIEVFAIAHLSSFDSGERVKVELGHDAPYAPLLNSLFSLRMAETPETMRLSAFARAETTRRILLARLARHVAETPMLLVLEDLHWFDSGSWSLLNEVAEARLPILLIVTTRPLDGEVEAYSRFLSAPGCQHLVLAGLAEDQTSAVIARTLGASSAAPDVASFVQARTSGNPFFVGELAKVLREAGTVLVVGGQIVMSTEVLLAGTDLDAVLEARGVPATLEGAIVARLDRLSHVQQVVIRAASVVGRTFDLAALRAALPASAQATLLEGVEALVQEGLVAPARTSLSAPAYEFRHVLLRDVAYHGMSFSERRVLHKLVALWMEQTADGRAGVLDTLLGYHFREAGETEPAARHLARAGEAAVRSYSNKEAATLLASAIELGRDAHATKAIQDTRGALELLLGRAYLALSRYSESKLYSESGLALAGYRIPSSVPLIPQLLGEAIRQVLYRYSFARPGSPNEEEGATLGAAAIALEGLAEIYYYDGDGMKCLYASLRMLNLAERLGPSPELARAYAAVSGITGLVQFRDMSANYRRRSLEMLDAIDDPGASAWALNLLGISRTGTGDWGDAASMFRRTAEIAAPLGERRRWRDGIEGAAIVDACRGNWPAALDGIKKMRLSAARDGDQRYLLLAYREQAFLELQMGRFDDAACILPLIKAEIDRGIKAEELIVRQDYHAIAGTLALERGDAEHAAAEADAALAVSRGLSGSGSPPHRYWTLFLVGRIYLNLWRLQRGRDSARDRYSSNAATVYRLLKRLSGAHPIAAPSAFLVRGGSEWLRGRPDRAQRDWRRALSIASKLAMGYEAALARKGLLRVEARSGDSAVALEGLPLLDLAPGASPSRTH
jgi:class 3 adenylate cyclase/tetratricopeptide (TPR) repeat protein